MLFHSRLVGHTVWGMPKRCVCGVTIVRRLLRAGATESAQSAPRSSIQARAMAEMVTYQCQSCGRIVTKRRRDLNRWNEIPKTCGWACARLLKLSGKASQLHLFKCVRCNEPSVSRFTSVKYCSDECRKARSMVTPKQLACANCGRRFVGIQRRTEARRFCSRNCKRASYRASDVGKAQRARSRAHRLALLRGGKTGKPVSALGILLEFRGKCGICRQRIDPAKPQTHAMSLTLDHIIPVSKGGKHSRENLQPAHRSCNSKRSNSGVGQMKLALVG